MEIEIITDPSLPNGTYGTLARLEDGVLYLTVDPDMDAYDCAYPVTIGAAS